MFSTSYFVFFYRVKRTCYHVTSVDQQVSQKTVKFVQIQVRTNRFSDSFLLVLGRLLAFEVLLLRFSNNVDNPVATDEWS